MKNLYLGIVLVLTIFCTDAKADHPEHDEVKKMRADTHAPYSIMADHYHKKNEIMLSYRWMSMQMDGYISGSSDASYFFLGRATNNIASPGPHNNASVAKVDCWPPVSIASIASIISSDPAD